MDSITTIAVVAIFIIAVLLLLIIIKQSKPSDPPASSPVGAPASSPVGAPASSPVGAPASSPELPSGCSLELPWKFYTLASVDGKHGVDAQGSLKDPGGKTIGGNWESMAGQVKTQAYHLPPPYKTGHKSWSDTVRYALDNEYTRVTASDPSRVLLVESPAKVVISASTQLEGLVVRRGGAVLLCPLHDEKMTLSVQFAIIESGR